MLTKAKWEEIKANHKISCEVLITMDNGIKYNKCFVLDNESIEEFGNKMDLCKKHLETTLINVEFNKEHLNEDGATQE